MKELEKIRNIINEVLGIEPDDISEDTNFVDDLGADSLDLFQIITGVEDEFGIVFDIEKVGDIKTVGDAIDEIVNMTEK